jgi:hypothetical protein
MKWKRNVELHTDITTVRANILTGLKSARFPLNKAALGYLAFPDYTFQTPQGAAFSVAKIVRDMITEKLIRFDGRGYVAI